MRKKCDTCKHYTAYEPGLGMGTCRGGPPTPWLDADTNNPSRWRGQWPQVSADEWCGVWKWRGLFEIFRTEQYEINRDSLNQRP